MSIPLSEVFRLEAPSFVIMELAPPAPPQDPLRAALLILAAALSNARCLLCAARDEHEVCHQPDWQDIGRRMSEALDAR